MAAMHSVRLPAHNDNVAATTLTSESRLSEQADARKRRTPSNDQTIYREGARGSEHYRKHNDSRNFGPDRDHRSTSPVHRPINAYRQRTPSPSSRSSSYDRNNTLGPRRHPDVHCLSYDRNSDQRSSRSRSTSPRPVQIHGRGIERGSHPASTSRTSIRSSIREVSARVPDASRRVRFGDRHEGFDSAAHCATVTSLPETYNDTLEPAFIRQHGDNLGDSNRPKVSIHDADQGMHPAGTKKPRKSASGMPKEQLQSIKSTNPSKTRSRKEWMAHSLSQLKDSARNRGLDLGIITNWTKDELVSRLLAYDRFIAARPANRQEMLVDRGLEMEGDKKQQAKAFAVEELKDVIAHGSRFRCLDDSTLKIRSKFSFWPWSDSSTPLDCLKQLVFLERHSGTNSSRHDWEPPMAELKKAAQKVIEDFPKRISELSALSGAQLQDEAKELGCNVPNIEVLPDALLRRWLLCQKHYDHVSDAEAHDILLKRRSIFCSSTRLLRLRELTTHLWKEFVVHMNPNRGESEEMMRARLSKEEVVHGRLQTEFEIVGALLVSRMGTKAASPRAPRSSSKKRLREEEAGEDIATQRSSKKAHV